MEYDRSNFKKILVVDDEDEILQILDKKLSAEGYHVLRARQGREAVEKARTKVPDLILMDIVLPDIDGAEVVVMLKDSPATQNIPVVFLSGIAVTGEAPVSEITVGGRRFTAIAKPFSFDKLLRTIQQFLQ